MQKAAQNLKYPVLSIILVLVFASINLADWQKIQNLHLPDSDDVTRVLEVRAWLLGQDFYDMVLHSSNPPNGVDMHWSRVSDLPLAFTQILISPFFDTQLTEKIAIFITPLWLGAIFAIFTGLVAQKLSGAKSAFWIAIFITILTDSVTFAFIPGRVDHHGIQLITLMLMLYGLLHNSYKGVWVAGFALALSLTIGFELLPLQLILVSWLVLVWGFGGAKRKTQIIGFCVSLCLFICIGFLINNSPKDYFIGANDELSIAQLLPILSGSILLGLSAKFLSEKPLFIRGLVLLAISACVAIIALQFPILFARLYWQVSPLLRELWLKEIGEMFPMRTFPLKMQIEGGMFAIIGTIVAIFALLNTLQKKSESARENIENWALFAPALLILATLTFFYQMRVFTHANTLAIIVISAQIALIYENQKLLYALAAFIALGPLSPDLISRLIPQSAQNDNSKYNYGGEMKCHSAPDFAHLAQMPKGLALTNINMGSETIFLSGHNAISTSFHRDMGKDIAYDIWISAPTMAKQKIKARRINYVAFCAKSTEIPSISKYAPNGLLAQLSRGQVPEYLEEIKSNGDTDVIAFKVK